MVRYVDSVDIDLGGGALKGEARLRPISWAGRLLTSASNGTNTWANSQTRWPVQINAPGFYVRFANLVQDAAPAASGEQSGSTQPSTIQVRAAALKLFASGTISSPTATTVALSTGYSNFALNGKLIVITNNTNGQQSQIITTSTGNVATVSSWLGGTPTSGATYKIYDWFPITFNGLRTLTADGYSSVQSDYVGLPVAPGDNVFIMTNVYVASGIWPMAVMPSNAATYDMWTNTGTGSNVDASGPTATGAWNTSATAGAFAPINIVAQVPATKPALNGGGDSIPFGTGPTNDAVNGHGLIQRLLVSSGLPGFTGGIPGETTASAALYNHTRLRLSQAANGQFFYSEWGVNDNNDSNGFSLATTQASLLSLWSRLSAMGLKVIQRIPTPFGATSTDGWTTAAGQTAANPHLAGWQAVNSWLRDTSASGAMAQAAGTLWQVFDTSPYQETATNSGKWAPATLVGSFTLTGATSGGNLTVSGTPFTSPYSDVTTNPDRYQVRITSGSGTFTSALTGSSGKNATINNVVNGNQLNMNSAMTVTPSAGDTIEVWTLVTGDGTHPLRWAIERENAGFISTIIPLMPAVM